MTRKATAGDRRRWRVLHDGAALLALTSLTGFPEAGAAAESCARPMARVVSAQGSVEVLRARDKQWLPAPLGTPVCHGDTVRVLEHGRAALAMNNDVLVRVDHRSTVTLAGPEPESPSLLELCRGALHFIKRFPRPLRVITPFINASVDGTEFSVAHGFMQDAVAVMEGQVSAVNGPGRDVPTTCGVPPDVARGPGGGRVLISAGRSEDGARAVGRSVVLAPGKTPPEPATLVRPADAVQWALYYPPVVDYPVEAGTAPWQIAWAQSSRAYREGNLVEALAAAMRAANEAGNARFYVWRAGLLLQVGRADQAKDDIEQALRLRGADADAHALEAIIAVVRNDKVLASALAGKAVQLAPTSPAAHIAMSYALQAQFKIDEALASAREAAKNDQASGIAWARVAELEMSKGDLKAALAAAERAVAASPRLSRTQTILGFAQLTRIDIARAKEAFAAAIALDSADPLPRLGNGLALIREGNVEDGRKEIEIAAVLDPGNALVRSYLGKAYFEEKRDQLAGTQFDLAKALDPRDPTPWFYEAIQNQTLNRPVGALAGLQEATKLNENRAVYRSRLALDQDTAARGISTARIYNDLGFEQLALVEGNRSVNIDPASHAAHRFLADTYLTEPRRDIARVSELLQSQLLQPLSLSPLQPQLGEDKLFILRSSGPANAGFNEYNALFTRNRATAQVEGLAGNRGTLGDQVVVAGIRDHVAWSLGQFYYQTDRFAPDNEIRRNIQNAFVQAALSPDTGAQVEYRRSEIDRGDKFSPLDPNDPTVQRTREYSRLLRVGARHDFSPGSTLLISAISQDRDDGIGFSGSDFFLRTAGRGRTIEAQHLLTSDRFSLVSGGSYYWGKFETSGSFFDPFPANQRHTNVHAYGSWNVVPRTLRLVGGLAYDDFTEFDFDQQRFSTKIGALYDITSATTIRAASFRVMKRPLANNQTLEPTQFAGFNQFYDDFNGTTSTNTALALDHKFARNAFAGVEWRKRDLRIPVPGISFDWDETLGKAYAYWAPRPWMALSTDVYQDHFVRSTLFVGEDQALEIKTLRIPVAMSFFNPLGLGGFSMRLMGTYVNQNALFLDINGAAVPQHNEFWVADAALSYRLPNRRGLVAVEARNLFDRRIRFQDVDPANPRIAAARLIYARLVLSF